MEHTPTTEPDAALLVVKRRIRATDPAPEHDSLELVEIYQSTTVAPDGDPSAT